MTARAIDLGDDIGHMSPVVLAGDFYVPDLDRNMSFPPDTQSFINGREHGIAFVAHVGRINAAELRCFTGECDQLFGLGVRRWCVFKRSRDAHCAILHCITHQSFHLLQLLRRWLQVRISKHHATDLRRPDVSCEIDSHALFFETHEILAQGSPVGGDLQVLVTGSVSLDHGIVQGSC